MNKIQDKLMSILQKVFDYEFKSWSLVHEALTRQSAIEEKKYYASNNSSQRLEFLGDCVLGMIISEIIFLNFPNASKEEINQIRSEIVKNETLGVVGINNHLGRCLIVGNGEESIDIRNNKKAIADLIEAMIGVIYLDTDQNMEITKKIVIYLLRDVIQNVFTKSNNFLFKNEKKLMLVLS